MFDKPFQMIEDRTNPDVPFFVVWDKKKKKCVKNEDGENMTFDTLTGVKEWITKNC